MKEHLCLSIIVNDCTIYLPQSKGEIVYFLTPSPIRDWFFFHLAQYEISTFYYIFVYSFVGTLVQIFVWISQLYPFPRFFLGAFIFFFFWCDRLQYNLKNWKILFTCMLQYTLPCHFLSVNGILNWCIVDLQYFIKFRCTT